MHRLVVVLAIGVAALGAAASRAAPDASGAVTGVGAIGITVASVERSAAFYADVLGFEKVSDVEIRGDDAARLRGVPGLGLRVVRLQLGTEAIELMEPLTMRGRPVPVDSRSNDRWFQHVAIVVSDMDKAYARLERHHVGHVSPEPQRLPDWNPAAGGIRAFYFKDPDDHPLEILWFPPGKGAARWHVASDRLFLGIDHTAIVVGDTAASIACYRDALGLSIAGESENWGPEQERLNDVPGARLRITTLRARSGPGVELLEYLTPRDGRASDARAGDLAHWETTLITSDADAALRALQRHGCGSASPGVVALHDDRHGVAREALARDADGHGLRLVEGGD